MTKLINLALILAFSICYMEWGGGNSATVANAEYELLFKSKNLLQSLTHPLILAGLVGQLCLLYVALFPNPKRWVNILGIVLLGVVVLLVLLAGLLSLNGIMIISTLPYIILSTVYFIRLRNDKMKTRLIN